MLLEAKMNYLGFEPKTSKRSGDSYILAKFMSNGSVFEFYVPGDKIALTTCVGGLKVFGEYTVSLKLSSYQNKAQVDLEYVND